MFQNICSVLINIILKIFFNLDFNPNLLQNNTNSPGVSSGKLQQTPTSAGTETPTTNNNILKLTTTPTLNNSKHQSPSISETPTSGKKFSKQNSQNRNAFLLGEFLYYFAFQLLKTSFQMTTTIVSRMNYQIL